MSQVRTANLSEFLYNKASFARIPISGNFELSPLCNFDCRMCYVRKSAAEVRAHPRPMVSCDEWLRIAREARDQGMLFLLLTGGEPLLWPDFWRLYDALIDMGLILTINTNGSLIDDAVVARFCKKPPRRLNITLYGASDETYYRLCGVRGVFGKVDRAIRSLQAVGIGVKLNCSLTPVNVQDQAAIAAYAKERNLQLDVTGYMFPPIRRDAGAVGTNERFSPREHARCRLEDVRLQRTPEQFQLFLQGLRQGSTEPPGLEEGCYDPLDGQVRCRAGKSTFWVTWDGLVTPCGMMTGPAVDLAGRDFASVWRELAEKTAGLRLSGICDRCEHRGICHPCVAMALAETGRPEGVPQYLCQTTKELRLLADRISGNI